MLRFTGFFALLLVGFIQCGGDPPLNTFPVDTPPVAAVVPPDTCTTLLRIVRDKNGERRTDAIERYLRTDCTLDSLGWRWGDRWVVTSLLHEATQAPLEVLETVLERGADPNLLIRGLSPTHHTFLRRRDTASYRLLLDHGGELEPAGALTVLEALSRAEGNFRTATRYLLEQHPTDLRGQNVARLLVETMYYRRDSQLVRQLLKLGADPNGQFTWTAEDCAICPYGLTPTFVAAQYGVPYVKLFQEFGADLDQLSEGENTLVEDLAGGGNVRTIQYLIDQGAPIGADALYLAADYQRPEVVALLLENGVDPNAPSATYPPDRTVLAQVLRCCGNAPDEPPFREAHVEIVAQLLRAGVSPTPADRRVLFAVATRQDAVGRQLRRVLRTAGIF